MSGKYTTGMAAQYGDGECIPVGVPLLSSQQQGNVPVAYEVVPAYQPRTAIRETRNETKYKDAWAAVLFAVMFGAVSYVGAANAGSALSSSTPPPSPAGGGGDGVNLTSAQLHRLFSIGAALLALGGFLSFGWLLVMIRLAERMIRVTLQLTVGMYFALAAVLFVKFHSAVPAAVCALFGAITLCYYYCVRRRIPFAGANLSVACSSVQEHRGTIGVAFLALALQFGWMVLWSACAFHVYHQNDGEVSCSINSRTGSNECTRKIAYGPYFGLLVSFYWGLQVFRNVSHTTTAGAVGSWWFRPQDTAVVGGALRRACTWSFGSICFGSLLVSILRALEQIAQNARGRDGEQNALACVLQCILGMIRSLLEWLNRWAFTYVGIYGYSFRVAGKAVFELFGDRGWTLIINDSLIENTLSLVALMNGALCAGVGVGLVTAEKSSFSAATSSSGSSSNVFVQAQITVAVVGFLIGIATCTVVMSVVESAVCTVFIAFAQDPNALRLSRPMVHHRLMQAYLSVHREILQRCGYVR